MKRFDIINELATKYNSKNYLEIGVQFRSSNFDKINCENKICVDPDPNAKADHIETSDDFFKKNKNNYDVIFIDGLHELDQVYKDIVNSLQILNENGTIVVHDCNPVEEIHQIVPRISKVWNGNVWEAWVRLREREDLEMFVVDTDCGCGIIRKKENNKKFVIDDLINWQNFIKNRKKWLNLISVEEFKKYLSK